MNKRNGVNHLNVKASHRKAIHRNMAISLLRYGRIQTTLSKAKAVRRSVDRLITRAKVDSVHNRREVAKLIHDKDILNKLFTEIATEFAGRPGGYTRVIKMGLRRHDAAELALLELVGHGLEEPKKKKTRKNKASAAKKSPKTNSEPDSKVGSKPDSKPNPKPSEEPIIEVVEELQKGQSVKAE